MRRAAAIIIAAISIGPPGSDARAAEDTFCGRIVVRAKAFGFSSMTDRAIDEALCRAVKDLAAAREGRGTSRDEASCLDAAAQLRAELARRDPALVPLAAAGPC